MLTTTGKEAATSELERVQRRDQLKKSRRLSCPVVLQLSLVTNRCH